jgi:hypothetical protein
LHGPFGGAPSCKPAVRGSGLVHVDYPLLVPGQDLSVCRCVSAVSGLWPAVTRGNSGAVVCHFTLMPGGFTAGPPSIQFRPFSLPGPA